MEDKRMVVKIGTDGVGSLIEVSAEDEIFEKVRPELGCDLIEIVRSSVLDAGSDRRIVVLVDESGAIKPDRKFNPVASSACGQLIFGGVAFAEEVDGEDGGEIVGLSMVDQARVLAFLGAVKAFMIRDNSHFIQALISSLTLGFASTIPAPIVDIPAFNKTINDVVLGEYDKILTKLKKEANDNASKESE